MGYAGKLEEKKLAVDLRKQGYSYKEIRESVAVSKDTLSRWCREVVLSPSQMARLKRRKLEGSERGRIIGAKRQQKTRIKRTKELILAGKTEVGRLGKRDRFIAGIGLYLGDGYKSEDSAGFSNSRPQIVSFMMDWFREFCGVPEGKFRGQIWIHDNLDERRARLFWSELTQIPLEQFQKSYIAKNKTNSRKIRKSIHGYGVFAIRISSTDIQRKILGWIAGILGSELV